MSTSYYSIRSFFSYLGRYKWRMALLYTTFLLANVFLAVIPIFIGMLVGNLSAHPIHKPAALTDMWILLICSLGHQVLWPVSEFLYLKLLIHTSYDYETLVFKQIINKPYPYFVDKFTGKISSYVTTLSQELRDFLVNVFWDYAGQVISLISFVIILTTVNWQSGLLLGIGLVLLFLVGRYTVLGNIRYEKQLTDVQSTKNGKIIDAIANFVNVKSFQREARETQTIREEQTKTIQAAKQAFAWGMWFWGSMGFIVRMIIWPISIVMNVYLFLHGELSIAGLTTFLSVIVLFTTTIWEAIWYISQFTLKLARIEEAHTYLFGPINIVKTPSDRLPSPDKTLVLDHELVFNNLSFAYPDKPGLKVLNGINLEVKKGEKLGIVGRSGGGKTTLTKLLLGYYPIPEGQLLLDRQPVASHDIAGLVSYVPQDTSLFHRSIADNIAYATDRSVTRQDIVDAAKKAHVDSFVTTIDDGYDALVGERGVKLSAGQRQRIAIARAFLDDKPILILDEATSALDSESELLVQDALEALWQTKTVIAIAHRLSTLRHMDRIIVIDNGQIVEEGNHASLLAKEGAYAKLWEHQSGGFLNE